MAKTTTTPAPKKTPTPAPAKKSAATKPTPAPAPAPKAPSKAEFDSADKAQLRTWCDAHGLPWDKRVDDEESLKKKLKDFFIKAAVVAQQEKSKKPTTQGPDNAAPAAAGQEPEDCFGHYFSADNSLCSSECPLREQCEPLSKKSPFRLTGELVELDKANDQAVAEQEAEELDEDEAEQVESAAGESEPEVEEEPEEKPAPKPAKKPEPAPAKPAGGSSMTVKQVVTPDSIVEVLLTPEQVEEMGLADDDEVKKFYLKLIEVAAKKGKNLVKGSIFRKVTAKVYSVDLESPDTEKESIDLVDEMTNELVGSMRANKQIKVIR